MNKCRTNTYVSYWIRSFDGKGKVFIDVFPQQHWEYNREYMDGNIIMVSLSRNNITMEIPRTDFEKHWRFIDEV